MKPNPIVHETTALAARENPPINIMHEINKGLLPLTSEARHSSRNDT